MAKKQWQPRKGQWVLFNVSAAPVVLLGDRLGRVTNETHVSRLLEEAHTAPEGTAAAGKLVGIFYPGANVATGLPTGPGRVYVPAHVTVVDSEGLNVRWHAKPARLAEILAAGPESDEEKQTPIPDNPAGWPLEFAASEVAGSLEPVVGEAGLAMLPARVRREGWIPEA